MEHQPIDYNYITDGIYIGTNQCCQTHFDADLKAKENIEADISLEAEQMDHPAGISFYIWLPTLDHHAPTPVQLDFGIAALEKFVAMKKRIYVHCQLGHGRAPTLVAAYLIARGQTVEQAINFITEKRPVIHLEEAQKQALIAFSSQRQS